MVRLQPCFVSLFCTCTFGNQYNQDWKQIAIFAETDYDQIDWNDIVQYVNQIKSAHELYPMHNKTSALVSISERFEKKGYLKCTVEVLHFFKDGF